jgi:hypothetical protein
MKIRHENGRRTKGSIGESKNIISFDYLVRWRERMRHTSPQGPNSPDLCRNLDEQLSVQKEVKEWRRVDEKLVMVGVDVEICDAGHPGGDERGRIDGLHVDNYHVIIIRKIV